MPNVLIYTTPTCAYCGAAKRFLEERSVPYEEIDVSENPQAYERMVRLSGQTGVPVIEIDGEVVVGFDRRRLAALLES